MIRASSVGRICTSRPTYSIEEYVQAEKALAVKVKENLKVEYNVKNLDLYLESRGVIMIAKDFQKQIDKKWIAETDPLPEGAKTYLQELWLAENVNFYDFSLSDTAIPLLKGRLVEDEAIALVGKLYNLDIKKNTERITKSFFSGECDVIYTQNHKIIRDNKSAQNWRTFRSITGISPMYKSQLVGYCYLYGAEEAWLDYTLMPTPEDLVGRIVENYSEEELEKFALTEQSIMNLPLQQRVKSFKIETDMQDEIKFLVSRLEKSEEYYNTLDYETCMQMLGGGENADTNW